MKILGKNNFHLNMLAQAHSISAIQVLNVIALNHLTILSGQSYIQEIYLIIHKIKSKEQNLELNS